MGIKFSRTGISGVIKALPPEATAIKFNIAPVWSTVAGTLGTFDSGEVLNETLLATDADDDTITYTIVGGLLPAGIDLAADGTLSGTLPIETSETTYNFTAQADDSRTGIVTRAFSITVIVLWRYFRLDVTDIDGGTRLLIAEMEIFEGETEYPTSNMSSNTAPSPLVASASSANQPAWHAFSGGTATWEVVSGTSGWLQIDLGSGNGIAPNSIQLTAKAVSEADRMPKDFTFEGSNTGSFSGEETVLLTKTGETGWTLSEERTYNF